MFNKLLNNRIIKIIGVLAVLYFGLLHDKSNPESLGNRLSAERVKKNINEIEQKGKFIATNISTAKKIAKQQDQQIKSSKIVIKELIVNNQGKILECGNEARISYQIVKIDGKVIYSASDEKIIIGSRKQDFLEQNIIGMHEGSSRSLLISEDFYNSDIKLTNFLKENKGGLNYQITLHKVLNNPSGLNISCNFDN